MYFRNIETVESDASLLKPRSISLMIAAFLLIERHLCFLDSKSLELLHSQAGRNVKFHVIKLFSGCTKIVKRSFQPQRVRSGIARNKSVTDSGRADILFILPSVLP